MQSDKTPPMSSKLEISYGLIARTSTLPDPCSSSITNSLDLSASRQRSAILHSPSIFLPQWIVIQHSASRYSRNTNLVIMTNHRTRLLGSKSTHMDTNGSSRNAYSMRSSKTTITSISSNGKVIRTNITLGNRFAWYDIFVSSSNSRGNTQNIHSLQHQDTDNSSPELALRKGGGVTNQRRICHCAFATMIGHGDDW